MKKLFIYFSVVAEKYFRPVTCFLFFNTFAMLGNVVANWIRRVSLSGTDIFVSLSYQLLVTKARVANIRKCQTKMGIKIVHIWGEGESNFCRHILIKKRLRF